MPLAGYRSYSNASVNSQNSNGNYWSSSPVNSSSKYFSYGSTYFYPQNGDSRGYGYSVRCFKNSDTTKTLTFDSDNDEDDVTHNLRWWEPVKNYEFEPEKE